MMKTTVAYALAAAVGLALATSTTQAQSAGEKIRIATEGAYAPWNAKDASGKLVGFEIDLAMDLCKRMGVECSIQEQAWDGILPALLAGKYDVIMAGMSITEERRQRITFSHAYAATPAIFVVAKDSPSAGFDTATKNINLDEIDPDEQAAIDAVVAEFKGKTIGVQTSTTHENFLRRFLGEAVDIRTYDTQENLDLDLQAGRVDAALASASYWVPLLASDKGQDMVMVGPHMTGGPFGAGVGAGIRQGDQALADRFSQAINEAIDDGSLQALAVRWFGFDASAKR